MARTVRDQGVYERILKLLKTPPTEPDRSPGYLDLLGPAGEPTPTIAQKVMQSTFLPQIYERVWRPVGFNIAKGWPVGPDTAQENALARDWLGLGEPGSAYKPAATVLDVACGPGNVTRALALGVAGRSHGGETGVAGRSHGGETGGVDESGLVVGVDASATMLSRAVSEPGPGNVAYVRGNAVDLPFLDESFDAVSCFGALYLFDDPWAAIDSMARVLKPGGHLVILTTRRPVLPMSRLGSEVVGRATGVSMFGHHELTGALVNRGFDEIRRRRMPFMQFAGGRKAGS